MTDQKIDQATDRETHDCTRCYRCIPAGREVFAYGVAYHEQCAPKGKGQRGGKRGGGR